MFKKSISTVLAFVLSFSSSLLFCGEAYAASQPVMLAEADGYALLQNADGSKTIRLENLGEEATEEDPSLAEPWADQGEYWANSGTVAETELRKTYVKNETLATLSKDGASISFAPLRREEAPQAALPESTEAQQIGERQTVSNVLQIGIAAQSEFVSVRGRLAPSARQARGVSAAAVPSAVYEGLFDEQSDVRLTALRGGIKEDIVVQTYVGNHSYTYQLTMRITS